MASRVAMPYGYFIEKSSESVTGPFNAVGGASSPYSVEPTKAAEFYIAE